MPPRAAAWRARSTASAAPPSGMGRGAASPCTPPPPPPPPSALPPLLPLPAPSLRLQSSVAASWAVRRTWWACVVQMHGPYVMCVHGLCMVHVRTDDGAAGVWAPRSRMPTALTWLGVDARCGCMVRARGVCAGRVCMVHTRLGARADGIRFVRLRRAGASHAYTPRMHTCAYEGAHTSCASAASLPSTTHCGCSPHLRGGMAPACMHGTAFNPHLHRPAQGPSGWRPARRAASAQPSRRGHADEPHTARLQHWRPRRWTPSRRLSFRPAAPLC